MLNSPVITLPLDQAFYFHGELMGVQAKVMAYPEFSHLELYLDDAFILETESLNLDTLLEIPFSEEGPHRIKVLACDMQGHCSETSKEFQLITSQEEAEDVESFDREQVKGWFLSGWTQDNSQGYDDGQSLKSSSAHAVSITRKQFSESGSISFYVKNGSGTLEFLVDGRVKSRWFGEEDWAYYAYSISEGDHVFKWISKTEDTFIDKVSFTPGVEQHTPGERFGGGTIFYLDSTGRHGLIAALQDGKYEGINEIPWGCYGLSLTSGSRARSLTNGQANTQAIVIDCKLEHIAARYCYNLVVQVEDDSWEDWYLPAIEELVLLHSNREKLEGLRGQYYWSSTSFSTNAASVISFMDGSHHGANRNIPNITGPSAAGIHVRPIRKF